MKGKTEVRLTLSESIVRDLIEGSESAKVEISEAIVSATANRVVKSALNNDDLFAAVKKKADAALRKAVEDFGLKTKRIKGGGQWGGDRTITVLSDAVEQLIHPLIDAQINAYIDEIIEEKAQSRIDETIRRTVSRKFTYSEVARMCGSHIDKLVSEEIQKRLGVKDD